MRYAAKEKETGYNQPTDLQHDDGVAGLDGREPVRHDEHRAPFPRCRALIASVVQARKAVSGRCRPTTDPPHTPLTHIRPATHTDIHIHTRVCVCVRE